MGKYYDGDVEKRPRIQKLIDDLYDHMPEIEADRAVILTESYKETEDEPIILRRAKALIPILVPLFISAFRIAQDLAMAMEARCYGSNSKKTRMNGMKICSRDIAACLIFAAFLAMIILERILL